jgi:hypothetical protein
VVIASTLVRVEMFRVGHTYDLLITHHAPGLRDNGKRPLLESKVLFRALEGYLPLDLAKEHKDRRGSVVPTFHSKSGDPIVIPAQFESVVRAAAAGANCLGCCHSHYLSPRGEVTVKEGEKGEP